MNFGNRWMPMEVMNTIFLLWVILAFAIDFTLVWLKRMAHAAKQKAIRPNTSCTKRKNAGCKNSPAMPVAASLCRS
jgi:hypothetical protein